jgi:general stress protein YciG
MGYELQRSLSVLKMSTNSDMPKARRGFAAMSPEKRREIAKLGGAAVPAERRSFSQAPDLASSAGKKGGHASRGGGRKPASAPSV